MIGKNFQVNRRDFLKKAVYGTAGFSVSPIPLKRKNLVRKKIDNPEKGKLIYRVLGRTGFKVPIISMGGSGSADVMRAGLEAGLVHIDTAHRYGVGTHEVMVGRVLRGRPRDSVIVATKIICLQDNQTGLPPKDVTPAEFRDDFRKRVNISLKRLGVDYLDVLYLHGVEVPGTLRSQLVKDVMQELKDQEKVRFLGVSFHHNELELIPATVEEKIYDVILTSYNFRQPHREEIRKALVAASKAGIGTVAMKTIAGAFWDKERKHPVNVKAALKWILQEEHLHTTIPGIATFEQLETDLSVMEDLTLSPEEEEDLKVGDRKKLAGLYCAQCGSCRLLCRHNLDIPTLMRSYMYAYGYKNPAKAKETLQQKSREEIACRGCNSCAVTCTMGFNVSAKVKDISRILDVPDEFMA